MSYFSLLAFSLLAHKHKLYSLATAIYKAEQIPSKQPGIVSPWSNRMIQLVQWQHAYYLCYLGLLWAVISDLINIFSITIICILPTVHYIWGIHTVCAVSCMGKCILPTVHWITAYISIHTVCTAIVVWACAYYIANAGYIYWMYCGLLHPTNSTLHMQDAYCVYCKNLESTSPFVVVFDYLSG